MKKFLSGSLALLFLVSPVAAGEWKTPPKPAPTATAATVEETWAVDWIGELDEDLYKRVKNDISYAQNEKKKVLKVTLLSGGGSVVWSLEIARLVWQAREKGLIVEMQGVALVASGATFVLASGTPGRRYISEYTIFLVHPPQSAGFFSRECLSFKPDPKDESDRLVNTILALMRDMYMKFTGKSQEEVEKWLTCGNEQAGSGKLAVSLGMADAVRE